MHTRKSPLLCSIGSLICLYFGHRLFISRKITNHVKEYSCSRCGQEMTDTASGFLVKLTPRLQETNTFVANIYKRRLKRKNKMLIQAS